MGKLGMGALTNLTPLRRPTPLEGKSKLAVLTNFPWIGTTASLQQVISLREKLFTDMRSAKSWSQVYSALDEHGFSLFQSEEQCFAVNLETCCMFELSDCGHNLQVFIERLGPLPVCD